MKILLAAAIFGLLAGPAYAQAQKQVPRAGEDLGKTEKEIKDEKEAEKAYQKSLATFRRRRRPTLGHRPQRERAQSRCQGSAGEARQVWRDDELTVMQQPSAGHDLNADQIAYWNGPAGQHWTERQAVQDVVLAPVSEILIERAKAKAGERMLDIGCGCGATTIALAQQVRARSAMCSASTSRRRCWRGHGKSRPQGLPLDFVLADATVYPFDPASFDLLASRFGVMFFADPRLSFANMRKALRPTGRLASRAGVSRAKMRG